MRAYESAICLMLGCLLPAVARAEKYAIVVGVNECPQFRLPNGSKPRALRGAEYDADRLRDALMRDFGFPEKNIRLLQGPAATRDAIRSAFVQIQAIAKPDDVFVFHFSGHGTQLPDARPFDEPDDRDEAICPADANERGDNLILDDELGLWLEDIAARHVTVLLDCCHAGTGIKDPDDEIQSRYLPMPGTAGSVANPKDSWGELRGSVKSLDRRLTAFFACRPAQQAYERRFLEQSRSVRAGQFTYHVLEGLRGAAADADGDGTISIDELWRWTTRQIDQQFNRQRPASAERQQPVLESDEPAAPLFGDKSR